MCTAILLVRSAPREGTALSQHLWPIVLASIRDEVRSRSWSPPGRWWPNQFPNAIGGRDDLALGTWQAIDPLQQRVAVLLNRRIYKPEAKN